MISGGGTTETGRGAPIGVHWNLKARPFGMVGATSLLICGSIVCATTLILVNKQVMSVHGFQCPTFLTSYHFVLTYGLLQAMSNGLHLFDIAHSFPSADAWRLAFFGVTSIVGMNFNLKTNSIGFYQLSKLCTIPCIVVYRYFALTQTTPGRTLLALAILLSGLSLFSVNDVQFNAVGCAIALVAVVTTATYQTMTAALQSQFGVTGTQLSHRVGLQQFVICFVAALAIETRGTKSIFAQSFHFMQVALVLSTGAFAVLSNVIGFSLIGKAGPITFQVVGHVKTMMIFVFGLVLFPERQETEQQLMKKIVGLTISMSGVVLYTVFEIHQKERERLATQRLVPIENHIDEKFESIGDEGFQDDD